MAGPLVQFEITLAGESAFRDWIAGRIAAVENLRSWFEQLATDFYAFETAVFAAEGAHEGLPGWKSLTEKYARWKNRRHAGARILVQTGALRDALTDRGAPGAIYELTDDYLRMGADRRTADGRWNIGWLHQRGTANMPARPPLRLSNLRIKRWISLLAAHIRGET